jgi:hypothetical protein
MSEPTTEARSETTPPDAVRKFVPKRKQPDAHPTDRAGEALLAILKEAAAVAYEDRDRVMTLTHELSRRLQAAQDRLHHLEDEVEHFRARAASAEKWLQMIEREIEQTLIAPIAERS